MGVFLPPGEVTLILPALISLARARYKLLSLSPVLAHNIMLVTAMPLLMPALLAMPIKVYHKAIEAVSKLWVSSQSLNALISPG